MNRLSGILINVYGCAPRAMTIDIIQNTSVYTYTAMGFGAYAAAVDEIVEGISVWIAGCSGAWCKSNNRTAILTRTVFLQNPVHTR